MLHDGALFLHIAAGAVAILAGYAALALRKGGRPHRVAGDVFCLAMLVMAGFATGLSIAAGQRLNPVAGVIVLYLVGSAWLVVRRKPGDVGRLEVAGCVLAAAIALYGGLVGLSAARAGETIDGVPPPVAFGFASVAALAAALDVRMIRRGGVAGFERIRRHLWRMCAALFIATGSFFLGQMDEIPQALRGPHLFVLALGPLAALVFWMVRTRRRKRIAPVPAVA